MDVCTFKPAGLQVPISGRGLSHRHLDARQKACWAVEVRAKRASIELSLKQLAAILNVSVTYIAAAEKLSAETRAAIVAGHDKTSFVPLLNPPPRVFALPVPRPIEIDDAGLISIARMVGPDRMLNAAAIVEAAE